MQTVAMMTATNTLIMQLIGNSVSLNTLTPSSIRITAFGLGNYKYSAAGGRASSALGFTPGLLEDAKDSSDFS